MCIPMLIWDANERWVFFPVLALYFFIDSCTFLKNLFMRDTERERQRHRQKEKQAPCGESNAGLDPRTPGSCPEQKADAQPLNHPGVPDLVYLCVLLISWDHCCLFPIGWLSWVSSSVVLVLSHLFSERCCQEALVGRSWWLTIIKCFFY